MKLSELTPIPMARIAVVVPRSRLREALVAIAEAGVMEIEEIGRDEDGDAERLLREAPPDTPARLSPERPDLERLRDSGAWDLVAGEAELTRRSRDAVEHGPAAVLVGWVLETGIDGLSERLAGRGASLVRLPRPRAVEAPTRMAEGRLRRSLRPLVHTYAVVPYEDVDPSLFAGVTYVLMFGMMFGDVGHGLVLAALGVLLARSRRPAFRAVRRLWLFPVAAGLAAAVFGLLYGEAFGPTGLVPTLWLSPLEEPVRLLVSALGAGAVLIAISYAIGTVNRWREGGPSHALYATTGIAGAMLFLGMAVLAGAVAWRNEPLGIAGGTLAAAGLVLSFIGMLTRSQESPGAAVAEAVIEMFDAAIRVFANVVSFARLAAFGMTHAALGFAIWEGTRALWGPGLNAVAAVVVFTLGNVLAFALEALVAGVQALRLEYYELFSRLFVGHGRLFEPWQLPIAREEPS